MYYTYVLKGKSRPVYYIGYTHDLKKRLFQHNAGINPSTTRGRPWNLIFYEAYLTEIQARKGEGRYKHKGKAWKQLKMRIDP